MKTLSKALLIFIMTAFILVVAFFSLYFNIKKLPEAPTAYAAERVAQDTVAYNLELPGKNLFDKTNLNAYTTSSWGVTYPTDTQIKIEHKNIYQSTQPYIVVSVEKNTDYTVSYDFIERTFPTSKGIIDIKGNSNPANTGSTLIAGRRDDFASVTVNSGIYNYIIILFGIENYSEQGYFIIDKFQIEKDSTTTEYERYKGYTPSTKSINTINMEGNFLLTKESIITFQNMSFSHMFYHHVKKDIETPEMSIQPTQNNLEWLEDNYPISSQINMTLTIKLENIEKVKTKTFYINREDRIGNYGYLYFKYNYTLQDTIIKTKISELFTYSELKTLTHSIQPQISITISGTGLYFPDDTSSVLTWQYEKYPVKENIMFGGEYNYDLIKKQEYDLSPGGMYITNTEFGTFKGITSGSDFYYENESDNMSIIVPFYYAFSEGTISYNLLYSNFKPLTNPGGSSYNEDTGYIGERREITGVFGWDNIEDIAHNIFLDFVNLPLIKDTIGYVYASYNWIKDTWNAFSGLQGLGIFSVVILGGIAFFIIMRVGA